MNSVPRKDIVSGRIYLVFFFFYNLYFVNFVNFVSFCEKCTHGPPLLQIGNLFVDMSMNISLDDLEEDEGTIFYDQYPRTEQLECM
jgi:hypothetical protein